MHFGDIVLMSFPFTDSSGTKKRPALVILDLKDGDLLLARVSSKPFGSNFELPLNLWSDAGLLVPSWVRVHKLATLEISKIDKQLGSLSEADKAAVFAKLQEMIDTLV